LWDRQYKADHGAPSENQKTCELCLVGAAERRLDCQAAKRLGYIHKKTYEQWVHLWGGETVGAARGQRDRKARGLCERGRNIKEREPTRK